MVVLKHLPLQNLGVIKMALQTPTTQEINELIISQLETSFNATIPLLPRSFLRVLAKTLAAVFTILYKYGGFIFLQMFVRTASFASTEINGQFLSPLKEWGRLIGVGDPAPATNAELIIDITVENQTGTLPTGSQLVGSNNGVTYITLADVLLNAPIVQVQIKAVSDQTGGGGSGVIGNLDDGTTINFANPLPNINRQAVVDSTVLQGADAETEDAYRLRVIDRFQKVPQGGAYADYEQWGEEPAGIINVYPYSGACPGQVELYCEATPESSGNEDGIPTQAQLQEVLDDYINQDVTGLASRRPANALANTYAIIRNGWKVEVTGIIDVDNLASTYQDIEDSLTEYFKEREPFIPGLSIPPRKDRINDSAVAGVVEDIVSAHGGIFDDAIVTQEVESLSNSTYTGDSFSFGTQESSVNDFKFNDDGTKAYLIGSGAELFEYDLTTAFDLTTMSYSGNSYDVSTQEPSPKAFAFSGSGTKLYIIGDNQVVYSYELSNGFDLSSPVTYTSNKLDVSPQLGAELPYALTFDTLGLKLFVGAEDGNIYSYNTTSSFSILGTYYNGFLYDTTSEAPNPLSLVFTDRGKRFSILDSSGDAFEYTCGVPFDFGSVVEYTTNTFAADGQDTLPQALVYNNDKSELFIAGDQNNTVYNYTTGTVDQTLTAVYTLGKGEKSKLTEVSYS